MATPTFNPKITLEVIQKWNRGTMGETLGIEITSIAEGCVIGTMPVDQRTRQPFGLLHGGASVALAETLGSIAGQLCAGEDEQIVGLEINANHLRAARSGIVTGTARALHVGSRTQVWEIHIVDPEQKLVCVSRITLAVIKRAV